MPALHVEEGMWRRMQVSSKGRVTGGWQAMCKSLSRVRLCASPPGSSVHAILQARILEWIAIAFSRGSSWPRNRTWVSCIAGRFFTNWATREWNGTSDIWWQEIEFYQGCERPGKWILPPEPSDKSPTHMTPWPQPRDSREPGIQSQNPARLLPSGLRADLECDAKA